MATITLGTWVFRIFGSKRARILVYSEYGKGKVQGRTYRSCRGVVIMKQREIKRYQVTIGLCHDVFVMTLNDVRASNPRRAIDLALGKLRKCDEAPVSSVQVRLASEVTEQHIA